MKNIPLIITLMLLPALWASETVAQKFISVDRQNLITCIFDEETNNEALMNMPSFSESSCKEGSAADLDPQDRLVWVKANLHIPHNYVKENLSYALYLFGKTSSEVYLNNQKLGFNGTPNIQPDKEFVGKMDVKFVIPQYLLNEGDNALVIKMSSHHGFMSLRNPLHFVGISENLPIDSFFNRNQIYSLPLLGILLLGAMYFTALTILQKNKGQTLLFLLMNLFVLGQLLSEMSRGLFNYAYPFHDLRLMAIVICALGFGWCLLIYVVKNVAKTQFFLWTSACVLLSLLIVVITPGFDVKTAGAILVPTLFASYLMLVQFYKYRDLSSFSQFAAFSVFSVTILLTLEAFHDLLFYYIITFMLCYLFIQQARNLVAEQAKRLEEQNQIAKLQFTLEQLEQEQAPSKLRLTSAGKVDVLDTNSIGYCKASGDYVEIYLLDGQCHLFSGSLKSLAVQLPSVFLKVHRSYVVNLDKVQSLRSAVTTLDNQASSNAYLLLKNQEKVPVSRRFMPMVRGKVC